MMVIPLKIPKLSINNQEIKRASYTKFLGVLLDVVSWKEHLKYTENKIAKSIGLHSFFISIKFISILKLGCLKK